MRIKVYYPSGITISLVGTWEGPGLVGTSNVILVFLDEDVKIGNQMMEKGSAFIGDPRGVYQDQDSGAILYDPREAIVGMEKVWVDWLTEHPEWPGVLELSV